MPAKTILVGPTDNVDPADQHTHVLVIVDGLALCATREVQILSSMILKLTNYNKIALTLFRFNYYTNT